MAAGGNSSEWLKIGHYDTEKAVASRHPEQVPRGNSDFPNVGVRGSNCAPAGMNSARSQA
jgi:hypothetical protein